MAYNKIIFNGSTRIDLTGTTATADKILTGYGAYGANGVWMDGSLTVAGWLPSTAELVASATETINLSADTSYDSWTPSTSNTSILAAGSARAACSYKITTDYQDTALIGICLMQTDFAYPSGTTFAKGYQISKSIFAVCHYAPMKLPDYSNNYYGRVMTGVIYNQAYYASASSIGLYTGSAYGVGATTCTWSTSSATSTSARTVGFTRPIIYARCHSTYFSTAAAAAVDSANSNITCKYRIYKIDKTESPLYAMFDSNNGDLYT